MKLLTFPFNYPSNNKPVNSPLYDLSVHTLPDTSLLLHDRPFFVPDFAEECRATIQLAIRICRLGRSISKHFARRYYDAVTVAVHFTAHPLLEQLQEAGLPWDAACGFDGAVALGEFVKLNDDIPLQTYHLLMECNGVPVQSVLTEEMLHPIDTLIATASQHYTFRQGDILLTGAPLPSIPVCIDSHITAYLDETRCLSFNVK